MLVCRVPGVFRAKFCVLPTPGEHQRLDAVESEVSKDRTCIPNGIRLGLLEVLEISVGIQHLLFYGRLPEPDVTLPSRRAIPVDDGERLPS